MALRFTTSTSNLLLNLLITSMKELGFCPRGRKLWAGASTLLIGSLLLSYHSRVRTMLVDAFTIAGKSLRISYGKGRSVVDTFLLEKTYSVTTMVLTKSYKSTFSVSCVLGGPFAFII